jgi:hypothetical protein
MAQAVSDVEASQGLSALAKAYRSQADLLKKARKTFGKSRRRKKAASTTKT